MDTKPAQTHDLTRDYFDVLHAAGEEASFNLWRFDGEKPLEKLYFDHRQYDGVSAVCEVSRRFDGQGFTPPQLNVIPKPHLIKQLWQLCTWYFRLIPALGRAWKKGSGEKKRTSAFVMVKKSCNLTHVLTALDVVSQRHLIASPLPRLWMIPVGLYSKITQDITPQNRVSFVDVKLTYPGEQSKSIKQQLKRDLSEGLYWGSILTLYAPKLVGRNTFIKMLRTMDRYFRRTGTLTYIGSWQIPTLPAHEWWAIEATVASISPVGASMLEINGQLGLGIQFHPTLQWTQVEAQQFAEEWKAEVLRQTEQAF